jgi:3-phenylpropionate/trans-cinnamate dioxygenase ferredoxin reductase subunit
MTPDPQAPNVIAIGAGLAGGDVVTQLRQNGFEGELILIGEEPHLPYLRPPLSKAFLAGEVTASSLQTKGAAAYETPRSPCVPGSVSKRLTGTRNGSLWTMARCFLTAIWFWPQGDGRG